MYGHRDSALSLKKGEKGRPMYYMSTKKEKEPFSGRLLYLLRGGSFVQ